MVSRLSFLFLSFLTLTAQAGDQDQLKVGVQPDGRIVVPTNQVLKPAGTQITFPGRPVSLLLIDDGKTVVVQNSKALLFIDVASCKIRQTLASPVGLSVMGLAGNSARLYTSDAKGQVRVAGNRPTSRTIGTRRSRCSMPKKRPCRRNKWTRPRALSRRKGKSRSWPILPAWPCTAPRSCGSLPREATTSSRSIWRRAR